MQVEHQPTNSTDEFTDFNQRNSELKHPFAGPYWGCLFADSVRLGDLLGDLL